MSDRFWQSALVRALVAERDYGGAVRAAREHLGMRRAALGEVVGYSHSTISRLERNLTATADLAQRKAVAAAVGMPDRVFWALMGDARSPTVTVTGSAPGAGEDDDPMRRRSLLAAVIAVPAGALAGVDDALAVLPTPRTEMTFAQVAGRLERARRMFDRGRSVALLGELPDLLATAEAAAAGGERRALVVLAGAYELASEVLSKVGSVESSRITADRAVLTAARAEDSVAAAGAARALGVVLRHQGRARVAEEVTVQAAGRIESTGLREPDEASAFAQLLCTTAYSTAQAGDRAGALEMIALSRRAARGTSARPTGWQRARIDGPQVALYEVGVSWALGDLGRALEVTERLDEAMFATPERKARLYTDKARVHWRSGDAERSVTALLSAHRHAPAEVTNRASIRRLGLDVVQRNTRAPGARNLAALLGAR